MYFVALLLLVIPAIIAAERKNELVLLGDEKIGSVVKSAQPKFRADQLPTNFDYRTKGLLTTDLNQHIPVYW